MRFQDDVEQLRKVEEYAIGDVVILPIDENQEAREQLEKSMPSVPKSIKEKWAFSKYPIKHTVFYIESPVILVDGARGYYCKKQSDGKKVFLSIQQIQVHLAKSIKEKWGIPTK